ncbi:hypothetical protein PRIPAC_72988 [Pristionchus pacificus]|uniref:Uncharacterized protein n=1 Tax=Pristionchus pacificus TaxID=54126 RepID=A0A2A6CSW5_PRIPA|nr:hypothetical protein PRIPAC_72988 [Pristionchus pacificus]|eukprot:PDM81312.1 hypothetical protein PRIPAC_36315 [Pristionchus pacificus]
MGSPGQLTLLLWKCWKTTTRSLGWTICLFTIILWAILFYMGLTKTSEFWNLNSPNKDMGEGNPYISTNGTCSYNTNAMASVMYLIFGMLQREFLRLHKLNDNPPELEADYEPLMTMSLPFEKKDCERIGQSSEQFDHGWYARCRATPLFQPLVVWVTGIKRFYVKFITKTTDDRSSEITNIRIWFFLILPLVIFCAQSTREVSEEAASNIKVVGHATTVFRALRVLSPKPFDPSPFDLQHMGVNDQQRVGRIPYCDGILFRRHSKCWELVPDALPPVVYRYLNTAIHFERLYE